MLITYNNAIKHCFFYMKFTVDKSHTYNTFTLYKSMGLITKLKIYRQSICLFSESTAEIEAYIEQGFDKSTATFIINIPDAAPKGILKVKDVQPGTFFLLFICYFFYFVQK